MPQMSPMWWEILFTMFIFLFMFMNVIMYFNKMMTPKNKSFLIKVNQFKWKW